MRSLFDEYIESCKCCGQIINTFEKNIFNGTCSPCFKKVNNVKNDKDIKTGEEIHMCITCGKKISEDENDDNKGYCDSCYYESNIDDGSYIGLFEC